MHVQMLSAVMALNRRKRQGRERHLAAIPEADSEEEVEILTASYEVSLTLHVGLVPSSAVKGELKITRVKRTGLSLTVLAAREAHLHLVQHSKLWLQGKIVPFCTNVDRLGVDADMCCGTDSFIVRHAFPVTVLHVNAVTAQQISGDVRHPTCA